MIRDAAADALRRSCGAFAASLALASCADSQPTRFYTLAGLAGRAGEAHAGVAARPHASASVRSLCRPTSIARSWSRAPAAIAWSWPTSTAGPSPCKACSRGSLRRTWRCSSGPTTCCCCPSAGRSPLDYQVEVDVTRFDVDTERQRQSSMPGGGCSAGTARGSCGAAARRSPSRPRPATIPPPPRALSRALGAMSTEIAQAIADQA